MTYEDDLGQRRREDDERSRRQEDDRRQDAKHFRTWVDQQTRHRQAAEASTVAWTGIAAKQRALHANHAANAPEYAKRANADLAVHNYGDAIVNLNNAITWQPESALFYAWRSHCHFMLGRYADAVTDATVALSHDRDCAYAYYNRGCAFSMMGAIELAIDDFDRFIERPGLFPHLVADACVWRGSAKHDLKRHEEAIGDLTTAIKLNPTADAFRCRARAHKAVDDYAAALADLNEVIERNATPDDYVQRGWAYVILGQSDDKALSDFDTAIRLGDTTAHAYLGRAHANRDRRHTAQALEDYSMAIRLEPGESGSAHLNRGYLRVDLGQCEAALADFDEAVRIFPREPRPYMARGDCRLKVGDYSGAKQDFLKAAELYGEQSKPDQAEKARRAFGA